MIAESKINPLVVPYWHIGMDHILPNYPPYIPRVGKKVTMLIGDAMDFKEMLAQMRNEKRSPVSSSNFISIHFIFILTFKVTSILLFQKQVLFSLLVNGSENIKLSETI